MKTSQASKQETLDIMWQRLSKGQVESACLHLPHDLGASQIQQNPPQQLCTHHMHRTTFPDKRVGPCHLPAFQNTRAQDLRTDFRNNTLLGQARSQAESAGRGRGRSVGGSAPPWSSLHSGTGQDIGWGRECICYTKTRCCLVYPQQGHFCHILIAFPSIISSQLKGSSHPLCAGCSAQRL